MQVKNTSYFYEFFVFVSQTSVAVTPSAEDKKENSEGF